MQQLSLFAPARLPRKPYVTDDPELGLTVRRAERALEWPYIQPNPPALRYRLVFDLDRPASVFAAEDAHVAPFSWVAENPVNGHAHGAYEIEVPIVMTDAGRQQPVRFAAAVEHAYMLALKADIGYSGTICKNPLHDRWRTQIHRQKPYDLQEMADYVDLPKKITKRQLIESPMGRNVTVFDRLREWAYRNIRHYRDGCREDWMRAVQLQGSAFNDFATSLPANEVGHIAKSVAKWVWRNFNPAAIAESDAKFSALQAHRGRQSGATRREQADARMIEAVSMEARGMTQKAIAIALGVTDRTVRNLLQEAKIRASECAFPAFFEKAETNHNQISAP